MVWLLRALLSLALIWSLPAAADREGQFENAGLVLHYSELGKGDAVVLLSGGPGFSPSYLRGLVALLAKDHRVIVLDQRGTGRSKPASITPQTVNMALMLDDLEALRRHLGLGRWSVIGHSFGAYTAMRYAIAHPAEVSHLVLMGTVAPVDRMQQFAALLDSRTTPAMRAALAESDQRAGAATTDEQRDAAVAESAAIMLPAYFSDASHIPKLIETLAPGALTTATYGVLSEEVKGYDLTAQLSVLKVPTLVLQGADDPLTPEIAAQVRDAIPGAKLVIVPHSGHFSWIETPEPVAAELRDFLR